MEELTDAQKTILMNKPDFEERVDGLYPTPDGNVYFAQHETHDGETTFYARNDLCAINYALGLNKRLKSVERIQFLYNKVYPVQEFTPGLILNIPLCNHEIISKGEEEDDWGMTRKFLHVSTPMTGILLEFADYPNDGWNIFMPEKHVIIYVSTKMLKEKNP
jgi:hypothetical protein